MRRTYIIIPLFLTTCFACYDLWYSRGQQLTAIRWRENNARARNELLYEGRDGEYAKRNGKMEALADLSQGMPKLLLYGRVGSNEVRAALLKQRFGVTLEAIAGCIVSEPLVTFANSYNKEVHAYIATKYGPTALYEVEQEARGIRDSNREKD